MNPAGPQAARIGELGTFLTVISSTVFVIVIGFLLYALWRGSRRAENAAGPEVERRMAAWVAGGIGATVIILFAFLIHSLATGRALAAFASGDALTIRVVGHQWWWEVHYEDPVGARFLTTANEIHIPVGRRVRLIGQSRDVIHAFWVPSLHGKIDLIPGYDATTYFRADRAGIYEGTCAEFCGMQHAHMRLRVIAEPPDSFDAWYARQLAPARAPADSVEQKGQEVFLTNSCVLCHRIRGTPAGSTIGPDLTHLASRTTIAAGTLPNRRGHLAGWILDAQKIKPGVKMPPNALESDELHALLHYLETLR